MANQKPNDTPFDRALPSYLEGEKVVIGCLMMTPETAIHQAKERLVADDFFLGSHKRIYDCILKMEAAGKAIDPVTVAYYLKKSGDLDYVGGQAFIASFVDGVPRLTNISEYCSIIKTLSAERQLITFNNQVINQLFDQEIDVAEALTKAEEEYVRIRSLINPPQKYSWLYQAVDLAIKELNDVADGVSPVRFATGFTALDKALGGGLAKRRLYIVAARTNVGKSTFTLQAAIGGLREDEKREKVAAIFSLEMSKEELGHRYLHIETTIPDEYYKEANFNDDEREKIRLADEQSDSLKLAIFDDPETTPAKILADCLRLKRDTGKLDLVVIDYLALIRPDGRHENRTRELGSVMRRLKVIAGLLDCPVVTPAQIKREAEERGGRLKLTDLRDSDDIALDSDAVFLINTKEQKADIIDIEMDAAKMRGGAKFSLKLGFDTTCGRFINTVLEPGKYKQPSKKGGGFQPYWRKKPTESNLPDDDDE